MKKVRILMFSLLLVLGLTACGAAQDSIPPVQPQADAVAVHLSDDGISVDGAPISADTSAAVYAAHDIIYYEAGRDFTYGEGGEADGHSADAAAAHTVVHITEAGTYRLSGSLSRGQIAVDLGEGAQEDPAAVVTLLLDGVDIKCEVAPAVIFYRVYECGSKETDGATKDVDTAAAGANVVIADGSVNHVAGAYVARIYKPGSVVLNSTGTAVEDAKKLHKYDGALYSCMSLNVDGGEEGSGVLNIRAENEGLDSELHLTVNGGTINIQSGNDGINTNEDGVSVTTVNGGMLQITVTGETGEGDGIDSNGWLVINGGTVIASSCARSGDAGIDSDMGIHINGGTVIAGGHMLDRIEDGGQSYAVFSFAQEHKGGETLSLKDSNGEVKASFCLPNDCSIVVYSSADWKEGVYTLWSGETQMAGQSGGMAGGPGMMKPTGMIPDGAENRQPPSGEQPPMGGMQMPDGIFPGDRQPPEKPEGDGRPGAFAPGGAMGGTGELSAQFRLEKGGHQFFNISPLK